MLNNSFLKINALLHFHCSNGYIINMSQCYVMHVTHILYCHMFCSLALPSFVWKKIQTSCSHHEQSSLLSTSLYLNLVHFCIKWLAMHDG